MLSRFRLPSPAMVIALAALGIAIGGTASASGSHAPAGKAAKVKSTFTRVIGPVHAGGSGDVIEAEAIVRRTTPRSAAAT